MKNAFGWVLVFLSLTSRAAMYSSLFNSVFVNSGNIPDGNTTGWSDTRMISVPENSISSMTLTLNVAGGFNGDLYAYISHNGILVPLLNRVGVSASSPASSFGYSDPGFSIVLSSSAANDVHFYGRNGAMFNGSGQLIGSWQPDGRAISPLSPRASFDSAGRLSFSSYDNQNPNGSWTLFIADVSGGGGTSSLLSWQLDITVIPAIPEPENVALGIFAGILVTLGLTRLMIHKLRGRGLSGEFGRKGACPSPAQQRPD